MVTEVLVEAGNFVKQGDDLVKLDRTLAKFDVKRSAAALAEAKAELRESIRLRDEFSKLIEKEYMAKTAFEGAVADARIKSAIVNRLEANHKRNVELLNRYKINAPFDGVISKKLIETGQWLKVGNSVLELVDINHLRVEVLAPQILLFKIAPRSGSHYLSRCPVRKRNQGHNYPQNSCCQCDGTYFPGTY